jgi:hypothetical protein
MNNILLFEDFLQELSLSDDIQKRIKEWMANNESEFDFKDDSSFEENADTVVDDCMTDLNINKSLKSDVKDFMQNQMDLSDGISVIMSPEKELNLNPIDQVQRFQY